MDRVCLEERLRVRCGCRCAQCGEFDVHELIVDCMRSEER